MIIATPVAMAHGQVDTASSSVRSIRAGAVKRGSGESVGMRAKDVRMARILSYVNRMLTRLSVSVERLEKLSERVSSRIDKLEEKGFDLSSASVLFDEADEKIIEAKSALEKTKQEIIGVLESESPREGFRDAREGVKAVVSAIRGAHGKLVEAVREIKADIDSNAGNSAADSDE